MNIKNLRLPSAILGSRLGNYKKPKPFLNIKNSQLLISKCNAWFWIKNLRKPKPLLNIKIKNLKNKETFDF
jgi:hypothetical protein